MTRRRKKTTIFQRLRFGAEVLFPHDGVSNLIRIDLPELLSSHDGSIAFGPVVGVGGEVHFVKGRYRADGLNSHIEAKWDVVEDALHMSLSVTNQGAEIARGVNAAVCLQSAFAPTFSGRGLRTSIFSDDRAISFLKLHELDGYRASGSWVKGSASIEQGGGQASGLFAS